jgi:hypothetical protein
MRGREFRRTDDSAGRLFHTLQFGEETARHGYGAKLILLLTDLLAITLASERFFYALLFAGFQIKRVTLHFLDNVFRLHFALEAAQSIFKGFALLYSNLCQEKYTSKPSQSGKLRIPLFGTQII